MGSNTNCSMLLGRQRHVICSNYCEDFQGSPGRVSVLGFSRCELNRCAGAHRGGFSGVAIFYDIHSSGRVTWQELYFFWPQFSRHRTEGGPINQRKGNGNGYGDARYITTWARALCCRSGSCGSCAGLSGLWTRYSYWLDKQYPGIAKRLEKNVQ